MKTITKFEKDETVNQIFMQMIEILSDLYKAVDTDDLVSYFTNMIRYTISQSEEEGTYTLSHMTNTVFESTALLNTHIKLANLLSKYNKVANQN